MNLRVQGFYTAIHHLGKAGVVGDFGYRDAVFFQEPVSATGGEQLNAAFGQGTAEIDDAGFITHADQSATDGGVSLVCHGSLSSLEMNE